MRAIRWCVALALTSCAALGVPVNSDLQSALAHVQAANAAAATAAAEYAAALQAAQAAIDAAKVGALPVAVPPVARTLAVEGK